MVYLYSAGAKEKKRKDFVNITYVPFTHAEQSLSKGVKVQTV